MIDVYKRQVQHLMEDGFITGSGFDVNPKSLGYSTCTYVGLKLERGNMYKKAVSYTHLDDKKKAAYYAGIQIGQQISNQMVKACKCCRSSRASGVSFVFPYTPKKPSRFTQRFFVTCITSIEERTSRSFQ